MCQSQATLSTFEISNNYNQKHMKYQKDDTYREAAYASRRRHQKLLPSAPRDSKNLVQTHLKRLTPLLHFTDKRQRVYILPGFSNRRKGCLFVLCSIRKKTKQEMNFHQVLFFSTSGCIHILYTSLFYKNITNLTNFSWSRLAH